MQQIATEIYFGLQIRTTWQITRLKCWVDDLTKCSHFPTLVFQGVSDFPMLG